MQRRQRLLAVIIAGLACAPAPAQTLRKVKAPDTSRPDYPWLEDYMIVLERFPLYAERGWHEPYRGDESLGWFGDGRSDENGQRTLSNFIFAYAVLATEGLYDVSVSGVSRHRLVSHCLKAIRYMTRTHVTGDLPCTDGRPWGDHWQSPWWSAKLAAGADLLWGHLTEAERTRMQRLLAHEANRLLRRQRIPIGESDNTRSEENAWDTEVLAWAIRLCPGNVNRGAWREMLDRLAFNTLSVEADLAHDTVVSGRRIRDWVVGANVHPDFTIENHGFFHICYMACPLHSFAWDYYAFTSGGLRAPESIHHHVRDVWDRLLRFALWDGRFAYVGGKDWPRYAYGLYFVMPALVQYQNEFGDRYARLIERLRFDTFEREQRIHNDGSFFSGRFTHLKMERWPAEWETDAACNLALCYLLHKRGKKVPAATINELDDRIVGTQHSPYSQHITVRGRRRFASWSYKSAGGPVTGLICSRDGEHMLEWNGNLVVRWAAEGAGGRPVVLRHNEVPFDGGFTTTAALAQGTIRVKSRWPLKVVDTNVRVGPIRAPAHPIFNSPKRITSLAGLTDLDSIVSAGEEWRVLAENEKGGPSILEAEIGTGRLIVVMCDMEQQFTAGSPPGEVFANVICYGGAVETVEALKHRRIGYVPGESWAREALDKLGVEYESVRDLGVGGWRRLDCLIIDRTAPRMRPHWPDVLDYVRDGGRVVKFCIQDRGWREEMINDRPAYAFTHYLAAAALPDDATMVKLDLVVAANDDVRPTMMRSLGLKVANDIFNGNVRTFYSEAGPKQVTGVGGEAAEFELPGPWLCIDAKLSLIARKKGQSPFSLNRANPTHNPVESAKKGSDPFFYWLIADTPKRSAPHGSLCYETVYQLCGRLPADASVRVGDVISESEVLLIAGLDAARTAAFAGANPFRRIPELGRLVRGWTARGQDARMYAVIANWRAEPVDVDVAAGSSKGAFTIIAGAQRLDARTVRVAPMTTAVVRYW